LLLLGLPLIAVALPACSESAAPTKDQYVSMANSVCAGTAEKLDELFEDYEVAKYEAAASGESSTYVDRPDRWMRAKIIPEYERMSGNLKGIQPPDGDGAYVADIYADLDRRIEVLHNHPGEGRAVIEADAGLRTRFASYGIEGCPTPEPDEGDDTSTTTTSTTAPAG
jgi:hypothetical protein